MLNKLKTKTVMTKERNNNNVLLKNAGDLLFGTRKIKVLLTSAIRSDCFCNYYFTFTANFKPTSY